MPAEAQSRPSSLYYHAFKFAFVAGRDLRFELDAADVDRWVAEHPPRVVVTA